MRPVISVDFSGASPPIELLVQMCWPNSNEATIRLAKLGINMAGEHGDFRNFLSLLARVGSDTKSTRADVIRMLDESAPDEVTRSGMRNWILSEPFAKYYKEKLPDLDPFDAFLIALRIPEIRNTLVDKIPDNDLSDQLDFIARHGGLKAAAKAPSMEEIEADVAVALQGAPIRAGCVLTLFCRMHQHPADGAPSINRACEIVERVPGIGASRSTTMDDWKHHNGRLEAVEGRRANLGWANCRC